MGSYASCVMKASDIVGDWLALNSTSPYVLSRRRPVPITGKHVEESGSLGNWGKEGRGTHENKLG